VLGGHSKFFPELFDYFIAVLRVCSAKICGRIILFVCVRVRVCVCVREREITLSDCGMLFRNVEAVKRMFCSVKFCTPVEMITSQNVSSLLDCYCVFLNR
jgi:hypothetical protein